MPTLHSLPATRGNKPGIEGKTQILPPTYAAMSTFKAAEDSRTPRRYRAVEDLCDTARFWSAAVLCRFLILRLVPVGFKPLIKYQ